MVTGAYCSRRPAPPLSAFVDQFWYAQGHGGGAHSKERLLPTGTIELVIHLGADEMLTYDPANTQSCRRHSGSIVVGAHSGFFVIDTAEQRGVIGVHFKPGGAWPFLHMPVGEFRDAHVPLDALWGVHVAELRERLNLAVGAEAKFSVLETVLLAQATCPLQRSPMIAHALHLLADPLTMPGVGEIAAQTGLSTRKFIQTFDAEVGLTPKLFQRVMRFQHALSCVESASEIDWTRIALDCGYYDQAHFVHDFQSFAGINPSAYARDRTAHLNHVPLFD